MVTIEDLMREITAMRTEFRDHAAVAVPVLERASVLLATHGDDELVRKRIAFINSWMEREADYKLLRRAVIEKTIIAALWAILVFMAIAIGSEIRDIVRTWVTK